MAVQAHISDVINAFESILDTGTLSRAGSRVARNANGVFFYDDTYTRRHTERAANAFASLDFSKVADASKSNFQLRAQTAVVKIKADIKLLKQTIESNNSSVGSFALVAQQLQSKGFDIESGDLSQLQDELREKVKVLEKHLAIAQAAAENKTLAVVRMAKPETNCEKVKRYALTVLPYIATLAAGLAGGYFLGK